MVAKTCVRNVWKLSRDEPESRIFLVAALLVAAYSWLGFAGVEGESVTAAGSVLAVLLLPFTVLLGLLGAVFRVDLWAGGESYPAHALWVVGSAASVFVGAAIVTRLSRYTKSMLPPRVGAVLMPAAVVAWLGVLAAVVLVEAA